MSSEPIILVVDDEPDNFDVIETLLYNEPYLLSYLSSGDAVLELLDKIQPDVILLDVMMPGTTGIDTCQQIKSTARWQPIPIIMLTALTSKEDLAYCLEAGADDFISKPINGLELRARVHSALRSYQRYKEIQELNIHLSQFNILLEEQVRQRTSDLEAFIRYDALTGLPSRFSLISKIEESFEAEIFQPFTLVILDCDQFQLVNSSLGYELGNKLLIAISDRLKGLAKPDDMLAHLGGDKFCLFLSSTENLEHLKSTIHSILDIFDAPFSVEGIEIYITASYGISLVSNTQKLAQERLQEADIAMHRAKSLGKGNYQIFDTSMHSAVLRRLQLEQDMHRALENEEFFVQYQPIVKLPERVLVGFEALSRWNHPTQGFVSPVDFILCAEETGLIVPIGLLVLRQSCAAIQYWRQHYQINLFVSVNLSVRQFAHPTLIDDIDQILKESAIASNILKLEITESAIVENPQMAISLIQELRSRHIDISIDDFGTGYSSLAYLSQFPVDHLKLDRFFTNKIGNQQDSTIVQAVIDLGHALNMSIVAEGIETLEQLEHLESRGCDFGQGYFFSRPLSFEGVNEYLLAQPLICPEPA